MSSAGVGVSTNTLVDLRDRYSHPTIREAITNLHLTLPLHSVNP